MLAFWNGNLLGSIFGKSASKMLAPKWVNCSLLTTLRLAARDGQLILRLSF